jgi:hypothetical protein
MVETKPRKAMTEAEKLEDSFSNDQVDAFLGLLRFFTKIEGRISSSDNVRFRTQLAEIKDEGPERKEAVRQNCRAILGDEPDLLADFDAFWVSWPSIFKTAKTTGGASSGATDSGQSAPRQDEDAGDAAKTPPDEA